MELCVVGVVYIIAGQGVHILDWGVWRETPLEVVCNNHSPAPIYGGYQPRTGVYCGAWSVPGAVSTCCTWPMCWQYVVLGAHLVQEGSGHCKIPNFSHVLTYICIW